MNEWDKLKEVRLIPYRAGVLIQEDNYEKKDVDNLLSRIWVEGDKLQNLNHRLAQSAIVYEQKVMIANQKLQDAESWTEKGFVVIYKEKLDELKEETEGYKARYDDLHRITVKWQKKLEAIQKILENPEYSMSGRVAKILEVLGE